ncbi:hypothetical protein HDV00_008486 [Rhizophlyctis rosea]|nr:hypothetical protein HDV00_008486 [Rhizophlyctis rosea]
MLNELQKNERALGQIYKANAYAKAIRSISRVPETITSGAQALKLPGVGAKIAAKIDELLQTGKLERIERDSLDPKLSAIKLFERVLGIGHQNAIRFYEAGARDLNDLHRFDLTKRQRIGLKYFHDLEERIPREEMVMWEDLLRKHIPRLDSRFSFTIAGSYRRGAESSGDVDVILTHPEYTSKERIDDRIRKGEGKLRSVVGELERAGVVVENLSEGNLFCMAIGRLPGPQADGSAWTFRRIDLRLFPIYQYYFALLHFTGSDQFNRDMRMRAIEKGWKLNEYDLRRREGGGEGKPVVVRSEREIFDLVGEEWREPRDRN